MKNECWNVGSEYDEVLSDRLSQALQALGYAVGDKWWGVGGSQEVSSWRLKSAMGELLIERETYVGLTVTGPSELVSGLREEFSRTA